MRDGATSKRYLIPSAASNLQRMLYSTVGLSLLRTTVVVSTPNPGSCPPRSRTPQESPRVVYRRSTSPLESMTFSSKPIKSG